MSISSQTAAEPLVPEDVSLLPTMRSLVTCSTVLERVAGRHLEELGLTSSQFDIVATLGDLPGLTCKELGERTLITKGTLKPVLDRLEAKGLVRRTKGEQDSRQTFVSLTAAGNAVYRSTFLVHVNFMKRFFDRMPEDRQRQLQVLLKELQATFEDPGSGAPACQET